MNKVVIQSNLRSINNGPLIRTGEVDSFQYEVSKVFNDLPKKIREIDNYNLFYKSIKKYFLDKSIALSLIGH